MLTQPEQPTGSQGRNACETPDERQFLDELFTRLYDKIRRLAARVRWSGTNPTLRPTALAHEAYLKLRKDPPDLTARSYDEVNGTTPKRVCQPGSTPDRESHEPHDHTRLQFIWFGWSYLRCISRSIASR